jgi:hypothetical protein
MTVGSALSLQPPPSIDAISAEWMTAALGGNFPDTQVTSVTVGTVIHGTATKVRLLLSYNDAGHRHRLPPTMWLKAGYEPHAEQQMAVYAGETCFYRDLAAELAIGCPTAYFSHTDERTAGSTLILEDLMARNATFGRATTPVTPDQAAAVLDLLSTLHARYWRDPYLDTLGWLNGGGVLLDSGVPEMVYGQANFDRMLTLPRGAFIAPELRDRERQQKLLIRLLEHDRDHALCLVHGDPHLGNSFWLPDGSPGFLDWQTAMHGYWAHDIAYFIVASLTIADRRHAERDLIAHYLTRMAEKGVTELSFDAAWLDYRRHAFYALCYAYCPPELQVEDICVANAERISAALLDLQSMAAWDEPEINPRS